MENVERKNMTVADFFLSELNVALMSFGFIFSSFLWLTLYNEMFLLVAAVVGFCFPIAVCFVSGLFHVLHINVSFLRRYDAQIWGVLLATGLFVFFYMVGTEVILVILSLPIALTLQGIYFMIRERQCKHVAKKPPFNVTKKAVPVYKMYFRFYVLFVIFLTIYSFFEDSSPFTLDNAMESVITPIILFTPLCMIIVLLDLCRINTWFIYSTKWQIIVFVMFIATYVTLRIFNDGFQMYYSIILCTLFLLIQGTYHHIKNRQGNRLKTIQE